MGRIELKPLQLSDCEAVFEIAQKCLPEHWSLDSIRSVLKYENNIYYVAHSIEQRMAVGFAGIMVIADEAELLNIAVEPEFRRQGIGKILLRQMMQEARQSGAIRLLLEVRESNLAARKLYCQHQFAEVGTRREYYHNPVEDAVIMEHRFGTNITTGFYG